MSESMGTSFLSSLFPSEEICMQEIIDDMPWDGARSQRVQVLATKWVEQIVANPSSLGTLESFLQQFSLTSDEGLALMTLAEALMRVPDAETANALIADKIIGTDWSDKKSSSNILVKAAGLGLKMSGKTLEGTLSKLGKPVIRESMTRMMRSMAHQFVLGEDIQEAFVEAAPFEKKGNRMSYDLLGEGARTQDDADVYFAGYRDAIRAIGYRLHTLAPSLHSVRNVPGISVKLSALHPRFESHQHERCVPELSERLLELAREAAKFNIPLTVDAEESERLAMSLQIMAPVFADKQLSDWEGFGLAVQAYQKRAAGVIDWVSDQAQDHGRKVQMRLVKGAYWDSEIKRAQELGLEDYPVYTRKSHSDVSFLACAAQMFQVGGHIYPMFATHNAHTIAGIFDFADDYKLPFELQRLYGMGDAVFAAVAKERDVPVSIYAPVGPHRDLLPYLVRRILENGANSSFVNQLLDENYPTESLVQDPVQKAVAGGLKLHPGIILPTEMYKGEEPSPRENSRGFDLENSAVLRDVYEAIEPYKYKSFEAASLIDGKPYKKTDAQIVFSPVDKSEMIGKVWPAREEIAVLAIESGQAAFANWRDTDSDVRADSLDRYAMLLEDNAAALVSFLVREAGKTLDDAHVEIREAVDFCRYYANQGRIDCKSAGDVMPGPTGESNIYYRRGRGVFVCISPWNFPLAIFTGQIAAALMAGNCVVAKPAEQTPLLSDFLVKLWAKAGIPDGVLNLVIGDGFIGEALVSHQDIAGVVFTGSTGVARSINQTLAAKSGGIIPLIAETGGQNAMIVDSSALPEQVVDDVINSAFGSAGQRCSALRILLIQEDVAEVTLRLLAGAMKQLKVGDPWEIKNDIGPIIDNVARARLRQHCDKLDGFATKIYQIELDAGLIQKGHFFGPCAYEIDDLSGLGEEVFGPVLHVLRYKPKDLDYITQQLNDTGYGLTFGIHSRIQSFVDDISSKVRAGNVYVNRGMTGAVVGSQPFGGQGLSGTGPKAGGPDYLKRFCTERVVSVDTTAAGGNASLVSLAE